ncbi:MAG: hypothetical protein RLZZ432_106, partial [Chloroflexota bacterium]
DLTTVTCLGGSAASRIAADLRGSHLALYGMSHSGTFVAAGVKPLFGETTSRYVIRVVTTLPSTNTDAGWLFVVITIAGLGAAAYATGKLSYRFGFDSIEQ